MRITVESMVRGCEECSKARFSPTNTTHKWPKEEEVCSRIHLDWAYQKKAGNILVLVDSSSGWLEAASCSSRHSNNVNSFLRTIFARFGVQHTVVTDNAPEFTGQEMRSYYLI